MARKLLTEDKIDMVIGGAGNVDQGKKTKKAYCPNCKEDRIFYIYSGGRAYCSVCTQQEQNSI